MTAPDPMDRRPAVAMRRQRTDTRRVRLLFEIDLSRCDADRAADRVWELTEREVTRAIERREDLRRDRTTPRPAASDAAAGAPAD
jgi:hypothetical protein